MLEVTVVHSGLKVCFFLSRSKLRSPKEYCNPVGRVLVLAFLCLLCFAFNAWRTLSFVCKAGAPEECTAILVIVCLPIY